MPEILLLCGKAGSGKTFYANALCAAGGARFFKLSSDDIMLHLFDSCPGPEAHGSFERRCKAYLAELALRLLGFDFNVILDYGFWTRTERDEAKSFFSSAGHSTRLIYFNTPSEVAAKNLKKRAERLRETGEHGFIIEEERRAFFDSLFEPPAKDEDFTIAWSNEDPFARLVTLSALVKE